ncbi:MAG: hydrogenase nickel incorporation protein HypB [Bryobacteraceae bacterium]
MRRTIAIGSPVMLENDRIAADLRARFERQGTFCVNLMSSPGSGKTLLLERTLEAMGPARAAVLTGDLATDNDARRLARYGAPVRQIVTGGVCHLDARRVSAALDELGEPPPILFLENVGNLVCPASWDLGEARRVVLFSVTEGEDKPLKYPSTFVKADLVLLTKIDLLPHVPFDAEAAAANVARLNPEAHLIRLSAWTGEGLLRWVDWLNEKRGPRQ